LQISEISSIRAEIDEYLRKNNLRNILDVDSVLNHNGPIISQPNQKNGQKATAETGNIIDFNGTVPPVPPRTSLIDNTPTVGTKLEGLLLNELDHDNDFNPRSFENNNVVGQTTNMPLIAPPPKPAKRSNLSLNTSQDSARSEAMTLSTPLATPNSISSSKTDPFEMGDFGSHLTTSQDIENAIGLLDKRIMEMKAGFTRGISFGNDDFSLESLDPLKN